ncbi:class I SAM-dependent methyltransferase [Methylovulum psychrotolerans]|uniref:Methyltransferase type 11 domain-containing protein n=1 Tax=Methylovulum psychrotolerans TaxID=1704499 RepID=A0A1Z4BWK9_9GAMM|nr:class I SAM-dependent methyltransferase [Methylovulum psychrotolerans]ASF45697.1 hypothetical protein CEK71_06205 [Methylovulum psychrotolerans]
MQTYPLRSKLVQALCPAPKRYAQQLILKYELNSGLDIGCGGDSILTAVRSATFESTGIDVFPENIQNSRHDKYILGDFRSYHFDQTFDVVVLSHVIEHFARDEAFDVLKRVEQLANRLIYIETPYGFLEQCAYKNNAFQRHLSGWFPHDFISRGYSVLGSGMRGLTGSMGKPCILPSNITRDINRSLQWFYFRRPHYASTIAAIKYIDEDGNVRGV